MGLFYLSLIHMCRCIYEKQESRMSTTTTAIPPSIPESTTRPQSRIQRVHHAISMLLEDGKQKNTIAALDGVRAVACLSVLFFHVNFFARESYMMAITTSLLFTKWLSHHSSILCGVVHHDCVVSPGISQATTLERHLAVPHLLYGRSLDISAD